MSPQEINVQEMLERIDYHLKLAIRHRLVRFGDMEDLKQDLVLAVFVRCGNFDPAKASWNTFLNNVLEMEIRQFRAKQRWRKNQASENIDDLEEEDHPLTNLYPTHELNEQEQRVFFSEIMEEVEKLPEQLKKVCMLLLVHSKVRTSELLGIRSGSLTRHLQTIRELFEESKVIRDYFEKY